MGVCNSQTYNLRKGILKYGNKGKEAVKQKIIATAQQRSFQTHTFIRINTGREK